MPRTETVKTKWPKGHAKSGKPRLETAQIFPDTLAEAKELFGESVVVKLGNDQLRIRHQAQVRTLMKPKKKRARRRRIAQEKNGVTLTNDEIAKRMENWTPESESERRWRYQDLERLNKVEIRERLRKRFEESGDDDELAALDEMCPEENAVRTLEIWTSTDGLPAVVTKQRFPDNLEAAVYLFSKDKFLELFNAQLPIWHRREVQTLMKEPHSDAEIVELMKGRKPQISSRSSGAGAGSPGTAPAPGAERVPMTTEGHKRLEAELRKLRTEDRPAIVKAIAAACEHGDLSESAEYHAARERQDFVERRIRELEDKLGRAQVIDVSTLSGDRVKFGATVTLADEDTDEEKTWRIVGADESDPKRGRLSVAAPLARAMIDKSVGDSFTFDAPSGARSYEILAVEFR